MWTVEPPKRVTFQLVQRNESLFPRVPIKSGPINACSHPCHSAQEIMRKMRGAQPATLVWQSFEAREMHSAWLSSKPSCCCTCAFKTSRCLGRHSDPEECQRGCPPPHPQPVGHREALWDQTPLVLKLSALIHHWIWRALPSVSTPSIMGPRTKKSNKDTKAQLCVPSRPQKGCVKAPAQAIS